MPGISRLQLCLVPVTQGILSADAHRPARREHTFHEDGTLVWRVLEGPGAGASKEEQRYATMKIADGVHAVSYLAASGHTLSVVVNFNTRRVVGFGSDNKE